MKTPPNWRVLRHSEAVKEGDRYDLGSATSIHGCPLVDSELIGVRFGLLRSHFGNDFKVMRRKSE